MTEQTYPSWFYGPDDQAQVYQSADDVPPGWADHPSKVKAGEKDDKSERRLPRPELMEALRQRGVQFAPNAGGAELAVLLAASEPQPVEVDSNGKALGIEKADEGRDPAEPGPNPLDPAQAPGLLSAADAPAVRSKLGLGSFDHDGDGAAGGSTAGGDRENMRALRAEYEAKMGKKPFAGWDEATLREKMA